MTIDPATLMSRMGADLAARFAQPRLGGAALQDLLLLLELRFKLEQDWVLPTLAEAGAVDAFAVQSLDADVDRLRDVAAALPRAGAQRTAALAMLEGAVMLHLQAVDLALQGSKGHRGLDWPALGDDVAAMIGRWQHDLQGGALEDEEADPVGRPPR